MGNDGGTIAKRQDILSLHSNRKPSGFSTDFEIAQAKAQSYDVCAFCSKQLYQGRDDSPVVSDYKGRLYRKENILEYLIEKRLKKKEAEANKGDDFAHLRSTKDLVDIKVKWKLDRDTGKYMMVCPVSDTLVSYRVSFVYLRSCGCFMSNKALEKLQIRKVGEPSEHKEIENEPKQSCPVCGIMYGSIDVVNVNPTKEEDMQRNQMTMNKLKLEGLSHSKAQIKLKPAKNHKHSSKRPPDDLKSENTSKKQKKYIKN